MPVTPTYPGIYIEELPSAARTIVPAPTSVTVFIGYTHPFKTRNFNRAVRIFSYDDYEREFGGLYVSNVLDANVAHAVNQFFVNGGSDAWVVGLPARYRDAAGAVLNVVPPAGVTDTNARGVFQAGWAVIPNDIGNNIAFTAREPTDKVPMQVIISNFNPTVDTADILITYGTQAESYRGVTIAPQTAPNYIDKVIGTADKPVSSLVTVRPVGVNYNVPMVSPLALPAVSAPVASSPALPATFATTFTAADFTPVFQEDASLDKDVPIFNLLTIPGVADNAIWSTALAYCERKMAFAIMDPPADAAADLTSGLAWIGDLMDTVIAKSANGAIYFPYLKTQNLLTNSAMDLPPSGYVAGIYAKTDQNRGVWKAPAGLETTLRGTTGVVQRGRMNDKRHGTLNPKGVNVLRDFPDSGTVVFGARTLVAANPAFEQWRYVPVRRMALFIEQSLYNSLGWVVFEPNDEPLWVAIRTTVENFMLSLFNQNAFQGRTPSQAFLVKCDNTTTTQTDIDLGIVNILVGFRPLKPAEFVIIKITQLAGQVQS
jgi:phage tail sheath protein FI